MTLRPELLGKLRPDSGDLANSRLVLTAYLRDEVLNWPVNRSDIEAKGRAALAATSRPGGIRDVTLGTNHGWVL